MVLTIGPLSDVLSLVKLSLKVDGGLPVSYEDIKVESLLNKPITADLRVSVD